MPPLIAAEVLAEGAAAGEAAGAAGAAEAASAEASEAAAAENAALEEQQAAEQQMRVRQYIRQQAQARMQGQEDENDELPRERISPTMGYAMIGVAGAVDVVKFIFEAGIFIPIVGEGTEILGDMLGWMTDMGMCVWFVALRVSPLDGGFRSPAASLFSAALGDVIPVVNMAPFDCFAVIVVVRGVQKRDRAMIAAAMNARGG